MALTLGCDHRVIDGAAGARFLATLVGFIEEPGTAFCDLEALVRCQTKKSTMSSIIGAGPGGYVCAITGSPARPLGRPRRKGSARGRLPQYRLHPLQGPHPSGFPVRRGQAPPSRPQEARSTSRLFDYRKVWEESRAAADRLSKGVRFLLKKNGVDYIEGSGRLDGPAHGPCRRAKGGRGSSCRAKAIVLATGSRPRALPGMAFDEESVLSSTGFLMSRDLPKRLAILGAGAIGMETAFVMSAFGVEVTVVELLDRILPLEDEESAALVASAFSKQGVALLTGRSAAGVSRGPAGPCELALKAKDGTETAIAADRLLVSVGRSPNTEGLGLEEAGVRLERGYVVTGDYQESSVSGIYAIGDIVAQPPAGPCRLEGRRDRRRADSSAPQRIRQPLPRPGSILSSCRAPSTASPSSEASAWARPRPRS